MNATGSCADCKFFLNLGDLTKIEGLGECHRYPPRTDALLVGMKKRKMKLPTGQEIEQDSPEFVNVVVPTKVPLMGWCGEYAKALVIPTAAEQRGMKKP